MTDLANKLFLCTGQPVEAEDEFPEQICENCYEKILMFYDFQIMCAESLRNYLKLYKTRQIGESGYDIEGNILVESQKNVEDESFEEMEVTTLDINKVQTEILERTSVIKQPKTKASEMTIDSDTSNDKTKSYLQEYLQFENLNKSKENNLASPQVLKPQQDTALILEEIEMVNVNQKEENSCLQEVEEVVIAGNEECNFKLNNLNSKEGYDSLQPVEKMVLRGNKQSFSQLSPKCPKKPEHECQNCSLKFKSSFKLQVHIRKQECLPTGTCTHIEKDCGSSQAWRKGDNTKKAVSKGIFPSSEEIPQKVELLPQEQLIFKCDLDNCERVYKSKSNLNIHKRKFHNLGPQIKTHMCEICGKVFKSSAVLQDHKFTHVDKSQLPFACDEEGCQKRYCNKEKLKIHKMRHAGIKNFVCPHCGMRKTTRNELKIHINYHTLERTWPCRFCPKVCNSAGNLKMHVKNVHEGAKDFACRFCERKFAKADTKKYHEMIHTGEKPNECKECGRKFVQPAALRTHRKIHLKQKEKSGKNSKNNLSTENKEKSCIPDNVDESNLLTESIVAQLLNDTSGN